MGRMLTRTGSDAARTTDHGLERTSLIAAALPWLAVLTITACGLYVRVALGHWPRVYRDSPEGSLFAAAALVAGLTACSTYAMVSVAVLLPIVRFSSLTRPVFDRCVLSCFVGTLVFWLLCAQDPYGFLEWAFD